MGKAVEIFRANRSKTRAYNDAMESALTATDYAEGVKVFKFADGSRLEFDLRYEANRGAVSVLGFKAFDVNGSYAGQAS